MTTNALVIYQEKPVADVFKTEVADELIDKIEKEARSMVFDISTPAGRDELRSYAFNIAKTKTALDKMGKELTAEQQAEIKRVNAERNKYWERLEALQKEIRQPLTDFEAKEEKRVAAHESALLLLKKSDVAFQTIHADDRTTAVYDAYIEALEADYQRDWEEFATRAKGIYDDTKHRLIGGRAFRVKYDQEQAELTRLREEDEKRKQKERDDKIAADAAAEAKKKAEDDAAAEAKRVKDLADKEAADAAKALQDKEDEKNRIEAARVKAHQDAFRHLMSFGNITGQEPAMILAGRLEQSEAFYHSRDWEEFAGNAEGQRIINAERIDHAYKLRVAADEKKAEDDKAEAKRIADKAAADAVAAAQKKIDDAKAAEDAATAKREANAKHVKKINDAAIAALAALQVENDFSPTKIVQAIAAGQIPNVSIQY